MISTLKNKTVFINEAIKKQNIQLNIFNKWREIIQKNIQNGKRKLIQEHYFDNLEIKFDILIDST